MYLTYFTFPGEDQELEYIWDHSLNDINVYPFKVLSACSLGKVTFEPITILHGGNGSGKSTALNAIAEKLNISRDSVFNKSKFYPDYLKMCEIHMLTSVPGNSRIVTSDDVFDYMLNVRNLNEGIDTKRKDLFKDYLNAKYADFQFKSMDDYDKLKKVNQARRITRSQYVRSNLMSNVKGLSNGESAFRYFTEKIGENGLFILDEPENSLTPKYQLELKQYIEDSVRFYGCQFIISTHSPFLLSIPGAKIYDLDESPAKIKKWTELENVRIYREFFSSDNFNT